MSLGEERLRSIVESLLMISPDPVPIARLVEVICIEDPQTEEEAIKKSIKELLERYRDGERALARGFTIDEVAAGLQFRTVAENSPFVRRFLAAKPQRLSKPAMETLAIVAYRQPVTKPEIEAIRGVDVGAALRNLLERDLVKILGKRDEVGRPLIYGTTEQFLEFFGLRSLAELPTLREYHELDEEHLREVEALEQSGQKDATVAELAQAAAFMVDREEDPDMDVLDQAVKDIERVKKSSDQVFDPEAPDLGELAAQAAQEAEAQKAVEEEAKAAKKKRKRKKKKKTEAAEEELPAEATEAEAPPAEPEAPPAEPAPPSESAEEPASPDEAPAEAPEAEPQASEVAAPKKKVIRRRKKKSADAEPASEGAESAPESPPQEPAASASAKPSPEQPQADQSSSGADGDES